MAIKTDLLAGEDVPLYRHRLEKARSVYHPRKIMRWGLDRGPKDEVYYRALKRFPLRRHRLAVRTGGSQLSSRGSIPRGAIIYWNGLACDPGQREAPACPIPVDARPDLPVGLLPVGRAARLAPAAGLRGLPLLPLYRHHRVQLLLRPRRRADRRTGTPAARPRIAPAAFAAAPSPRPGAGRAVGGAVCSDLSCLRRPRRALFAPAHALESPPRPEYGGGVRGTGRIRVSRGLGGGARGGGLRGQPRRGAGRPIRRSHDVRHVPSDTGLPDR